MQDEQPQSDNQKTDDQQNSEEYRELVRQVADQVWKLWKEQLNHERERRGDVHRS